MITNIEYSNKESKKKISIPIDRKMIFIYGKNGSGKTTLSRSIKMEDGYVFNEDFIYKNVYVIQNDGAKVDPVTKNNFSELLIGEEEIAIKKEIVKHEDYSKIIIQKIKDKNVIINSLLNKNKLSEEDNILTKSLDKDFQYDYNKTEDEQFESYNYSSKLVQSITNDDELNVKVKQLEKQENLVVLNDQIESNTLLKAFLYSDKETINLFNGEISYIKSNEETITTLEKMAKEKNIDSKYFETIKVCLDIQKETNVNKCFLCGTENVLEHINEWNTIINDKTITARDNLKKKINKSIDNASSILNSKKIYLLVAPKTIECIEDFTKKMHEINLSIDKKRYDLLTCNNKDVDFEIRDIKEVKESIRNYLLKPYEKEMTFLNSLNQSIEKEIKNKKENLEKLLSQNSKKNEESINSILAELGLRKEMKISVDRYGGSLKYKMDIKNGSLNTLSDGQKHKLALAIFLNYIKDKEIENKLVVFDDPVVSLDESGYHMFKSYIINNVMTKDIEKSPYLIILTHNFNYLYVQISNIISNEKFKENSIVYKLTTDSIQNLDFHYFELDDIALFKECLSKMTYQFQLIDMSSIYLKIFRIFLDLTLRIKGIPDTGNPSIEIEKLDVNEDIKKELKDIHTTLCSISKADKPDYEKVLNGLLELKKAIELLGYKYISDEEIEKAKNLSLHDIEYKNDIFYILKEINDVLKDTTQEKYIDYLNHPRISFTQNIISTSMDN